MEVENKLGMSLDDLIKQQRAQTKPKASKPKPKVKVAPKSASRKPVTVVPSKGGRRPSAPAGAPRAPRVLTISRSLLAGPPLFNGGVQKASPSGPGAHGRRVSAAAPRPYGFGGPAPPRGPSPAALPRAPVGPPAPGSVPPAPMGAAPAPQARHNYTIAPRRNAHGILLPA